MAADPYRFASAFERTVIAYLVTSPEFFHRIGHALEHELFGDPSAQRLAQAAAIIASEGKPPAGVPIVVQRLARWQHEGRLTNEDVMDADDFVSDAIDAGLPDLDQVIAELTPVVQKREQKKAIEAAMTTFAAGTSMDDVGAAMTRISRLGQKVQIGGGTRFGAAGSEAIRKVRNLQRLSTGVVELDVELRGGMARGTLGVALGGAGDGKSTFLTQIATSALLTGLHVAVATLELPEPMWLARMKANATGVPTNDILDEDDALILAEERIAEMADRLGVATVADFTPHSTTVEEIYQWVDGLGDEVGRPVDLLVVDYADKCGHDKSREYEGMRVVYEGLRIGAHSRKIWTWTASQATRRQKGNNRLDINDAADSQHKARVADLILTLNAMSEGEEMEFYVAKNRTGKGRIAVGPLPTEFECGRIAPAIYVDPLGEPFDVF